MPELTLNERAALAMKWTDMEEIRPNSVIGKDARRVKGIVPKYTTDRNAAHLLLEEVGEEGLASVFGERLMELLNNTQPKDVPYDTEEIPYYVATAPLDILVLAAVEVLEAEKG